MKKYLLTIAFLAAVIRAPEAFAKINIEELDGISRAALFLNEEQINTKLNDSINSTNYFEQVSMKIKDDLIVTTGKAGIKKFKFNFLVESKLSSTPNNGERITRLKLTILKMEIAKINLKQIKSIKNAVEASINDVLNNFLNENSNFALYGVEVRDEKIIVVFSPLEMAISNEMKELE